MFAGHIACFLLGVATTLISLFIVILVYLDNSPTHPKKPSTFTPVRKLQWDPQLNRSGWLQISDQILEHSDVGKTDNTENSSHFLMIEISWIGKTLRLTSYLTNRFMGQSVSDEQPTQKWRSCYGVLKQKTLFLYEDESQAECIIFIPVGQYDVLLIPENTKDVELFNKENPILLIAKSEQFPTINAFYIYCPTSSDKEDWYIVLQRVCNLPVFADNQALHAYYQEMEPMKAYTDAMSKLIKNAPKNTESDKIDWLNALVGRLFVAVHNTSTVKEWLISRLTKRNAESREGSILGDIVIQDINAGNSLPVLSNPKLLNMSINSDLMVEMDIDYTGGLRVEAATMANVSVPALDAYMKPIMVPIVVAITIKRFSARVLLKVKPFWESNRIWFGFYHQPELKLELQVEPVISNKLIQIQLVNQVIENRIKNALEEYVMLPNMDCFSFWDFWDLMGQKCGEFDETEDLDDDLSIANCEPEMNTGSDNEPIAAAAMIGEAVESSFIPKKRLQRGRTVSYASNPAIGSSVQNRSLKKRLSLNNITTGASILDTLGDARRPESAMSNEPSILERLGDAAYHLGEIYRNQGIDKSAQTVTKRVIEYSKPAVTFAQEQTAPIAEYVQGTAAAVGLSAIERLGLTPDGLDEIQDGNSKGKPTSAWNVLGLQVSTSAPNNETIRLRRKRTIDSLKTSMNENEKRNSWSENLSNSSLVESPNALQDSKLNSTNVKMFRQTNSLRRKKISEWMEHTQ